MPQKDNVSSILLDADITRHFIYGNQIHLLHKIFTEKLILIENVYEELCVNNKLRPTIRQLIKDELIEYMEFPNDMDIYKEYASLTKRRGDGESACMAVAKHMGYMIASNNLKDIKPFCEDNNIKYFTTMDILLKAFEQGIINEVDCNQFIKDVKAKGCKLSPYNTISEYKNRSKM